MLVYRRLPFGWMRWDIFINQREMFATTDRFIVEWDASLQIRLYKNYFASSDPHPETLFGHSFSHTIWNYNEGYIYIFWHPTLTWQVRKKTHMVNQSIGICYSPTPEFRFLVEVLCTHIVDESQGDAPYQSGVFNNRKLWFNGPTAGSWLQSGSNMSIDTHSIP